MRPGREQAWGVLWSGARWSCVSVPSPNDAPLVGHRGRGEASEDKDEQPRSVGAQQVLGHQQTLYSGAAGTTSNVRPLRPKI